MTYTAKCNWGECDFCGECLMQCPVMSMDKKNAVKEIKALVKGGDAPRVFSECTTCFNCNNYCPKGLRPHELILERLIEKRKKNMPAFIPYLCNGREDMDSRPIMFQDLYTQLTKEEQKILESWSSVPEGAKEILWVGCIGRLSCKDLENSRILKDLPKFGPKDLCCGELAYRLHSWEVYRETIEKTLQVVEKLEIDTMICYCGSCYNYFTSILNKVYGRSLPFKVKSLYQWLLEKRLAGELQLKRPLNFRAAVHESCYVSEVEEGFSDTLRQLYSDAGMDIVELEHHGKYNLSCGATTVLRDLNPYKSLFREHKKKYTEVKKAGTADLAVNCPGCYITLAFTSPFFRKKLRYMPDELLKAYGDEITTPVGRRLPMFLKAFVKRSPGLLKKVYPENE